MSEITLTSPFTPSQADRDALNSMPHRVIKCPKKQSVYKSQEYAYHLYRVKNGLVKDFRLTADGVEQITHFYLPGEIFGWEALIQPYYASHTASIFDSELEQFHIGSLKDSPLFIHQMNSLLIHEQIKTKSHIALLNKTHATARLSAFILNINKRLNTSHSLHAFNFPRNEIANYLGLSVETVCRSINQLKKINAIKIEKTRIHIIDINKLTDFL
ncbi:MAG: helix-turn-helix domain-containing protein [Cellvibrionales bacterium]|nr:helix-turn-helix domain-containing protein [Cellvibrionales bacterium]